MVQIRIAAIPQKNLEKTIFSELQPAELEKRQFIDFSLLEEVFAVADKKEEKIDKPDPALRKDQPKVLSQQRATVIEIITNRIKKPVADIKKAIIAGDKKELTFEMLNELKSLFPICE